MSRVKDMSRLGNPVSYRESMSRRSYRNTPVGDKDKIEANNMNDSH